KIPDTTGANGKGGTELVIADGNGNVHAFLPNGHEAPGWPVHTDPIPLPTAGDNAYTRGQVPTTVYSPVLLGSPAIAPLQGPKNGLDVAVTALDGKLYAWNNQGQPLPGFPVESNPNFAVPAARDSLNAPFHGF